MSDDPRSRLRANATEVATMIVTGLWLALLVSGIGGNLWLAVLLVGYIAVIPLVALLFGDEEDREEWWDDDWMGDWVGESEASDDEESEQSSSGRDAVIPSSNRDALETLRERYAAGDLTDDQFERKLERLLETETIEDVEQWRRRAHDERTHHESRDLDRGGRRERDTEYET